MTMKKNLDVNNKVQPSSNKIQTTGNFKIKTTSKRTTIICKYYIKDKIRTPILNYLGNKHYKNTKCSKELDVRDIF